MSHLGDAVAPRAKQCLQSGKQNGNPCISQRVGTVLAVELQVSDGVIVL